MPSIESIDEALDRPVDTRSEAAKQKAEELSAVFARYMKAHEASMHGNPLNPAEVAEMVETVAYMLSHDAGKVNYAIFKSLNSQTELMQEIVDTIGFENLTNVPH